MSTADRRRRRKNQGVHKGMKSRLRPGGLSPAKRGITPAPKDAPYSRPAKGKDHAGGPPRPNPPRTPSTLYPSLDGLGQAALNAEADIVLAELADTARQAIDGIRQCSHSDTLLAAVAPHYLASLDAVISGWPPFAGPCPPQLQHAADAARTAIRLVPKVPT